MKRDARLYITVLFLAMFAISFVAAAGPFDDFQRGANAFFEWTKPVLGLLVGKDVPAGFQEGAATDFISRLMFLVIIFILVWTTVDRIEMFNIYPVAHWVVAIAVSILSTRWLSDGGLVQTILLPYDALGVALSAFLPLLLIFYFLEVGLSGRRNNVIRKAGWVLYAVVFVFLWFDRTAAILTANQSTWAQYIYPISAIICAGCFWFDGSIQRYMKKSELLRRIKTSSDTQRAANIYASLKDIQTRLELGETKYGGKDIILERNRLYTDLAAIEVANP
ncbi:MAG: hypothetical protein ACI83O_000668 [Patescibacteria group bacterium]|jgi:hypothetical protein